jgi:uncharacterized coiled-coil DUF342 family protein
MNDQEFQAKLGDIMSSIEHLPEDKRAEIAKLAEETKERRSRMQATIKGLQESLDHLRLSVKYMAFDLEATRRENDYLRKLLKGHEGGETG